MTPEEVSERAVLGSCMVSQEAMQFAFFNLEDEHFSNSTNRALFKGMKRLFKEGMEVDPVTLLGGLSQKELAGAGGRENIFQITEDVPTALHVQHYASNMRRHACEAKLSKLYDQSKQDPTSVEIQAKIRQVWDQLNGQGGAVMDAKKGVMRYQEVLEARLNGRIERIKTGFEKFDWLTGGFHRGNLAVFGARTSIGKTSVLLSIAVRFLFRNFRILFLSAEMTFDELLDRIVAAKTDTPLGRIRNDITNEDFKAAQGVCSELFERPLFVLEGGRLNLSRIRSAIETVQPDIVVVDYLQRISPPSEGNRAAFYSDAANELKAIALEKKVVVFCASQLNREIEKGDEREPKLSDLKESGGIEEAADLVILMSPKKNDPLEPERDVDFLVLKHRNGPTGKVEFTFKKSTASFEEKRSPFDGYHHSGS